MRRKLGEHRQITCVAPTLGAKIEAKRDSGLVKRGSADLALSRSRSKRNRTEREKGEQRKTGMQRRPEVKGIRLLHVLPGSLPANLGFANGLGMSYNKYSTSDRACPEDECRERLGVVSSASFIRPAEETSA